MKKMKANGCRPSLYDSISYPLMMDRELDTIVFMVIGARLKSIENQILAIKFLTRLRKEDIPKGKIHSFLNFATLIRIWITQSEMKIIESSIMRITETYMNLGRKLQK